MDKQKIREIMKFKDITRYGGDVMSDEMISEKKWQKKYIYGKRMPNTRPCAFNKRNNICFIFLYVLPCRIYFPFDRIIVDCSFISPSPLQPPTNILNYTKHTHTHTNPYSYSEWHANIASMILILLTSINMVSEDVITNEMIIMIMKINNKLIFIKENKK